MARDSAIKREERKVTKERSTRKTTLPCLTQHPQPVVASGASPGGQDQASGNDHVLANGPAYQGERRVTEPAQGRIDRVLVKHGSSGSGQTGQMTQTGPRFNHRKGMRGRAYPRTKKQIMSLRKIRVFRRRQLIKTAPQKYAQSRNLLRALQLNKEGATGLKQSLTHNRDPY